MSSNQNVNFTIPTLRGTNQGSSARVIAQIFTLNVVPASNLYTMGGTGLSFQITTSGTQFALYDNIGISLGAVAVPFAVGHTYFAVGSAYGSVNGTEYVVISIRDLTTGDRKSVV